MAPCWMGDHQMLGIPPILLTSSASSSPLSSLLLLLPSATATPIRRRRMEVEASMVEELNDTSEETAPPSAQFCSNTSKTAIVLGPTQEEDQTN